MSKIGDYEIKDIVGKGGMGKIYKAVDSVSGKLVIIKQLMITSKTVLQKRFQREADIMSTFNHPNIVKVYKQFVIGKTYYIVMEFVEGMSLGELIKKNGKISPTASTVIFKDICKGLKYAHDKDVVHRDIKPDNVLISKTGQVKLCDFGIATAQPGKDEILTKTGVVMGTPAYMSPEQLKSTKYVDKRSDIYSMGVLLYQMVTGEKPFPGTFTAEAIARITKGIYVKPEKRSSNIPPFLKQIIKKAMHCKPEKRYNDLQKIIDIIIKNTPGIEDSRASKKAVKSYMEGRDILEVLSTVKRNSVMIPLARIIANGKSEVKKRVQIKPSTKKPPIRKPVVKKAEAKKVVVRKPAIKKPTAGKESVKKAVSRKPVAKKAPTKKAVAKKQVKRKPVAKKALAKKTVGRKPATKKTPDKKAMERKPVAKKVQTKKATTKKPGVKKSSAIPVKVKYGLKSYEIKTSITIGRDKSCTIVVRNDSLVSRQHAKIIKRGKSCYIIDKSSNGTKVNSRRIEKGKKIPVFAGDIITIGKSQLKIR